MCLACFASIAWLIVGVASTGGGVANHRTITSQEESSKVSEFSQQGQNQK